MVLAVHGAIMWREDNGAHVDTAILATWEGDDGQVFTSGYAAESDDFFSDI
jgi:hypothetical protein